MLRRHPEAITRRAPGDLEMLAAQQLRMLSVVAPALLPGGLLVYAVCTFDRRECEDIVAAFLSAHPRFSIESAGGGGRPRARGRGSPMRPGRSAPGLTATAPTASSRSACASRAAEAEKA